MQSSLPQNTEPTINGATASMMLAAASFFDLFPLLFAAIPGVNILMGWLVNIMAWLVFFLWFLLHGTIFSKRPVLKMGMMVGTLLFEMVLGFLPTWVVTVSITIFMTRQEDKREAERQRQQAKQIGRQKKQAVRTSRRGFVPA